MASAVSETIPNACPGTQSQSAGKNSACQGCPNQKLCSSGQANIPDPAISEIKERLSSVKHKLLVLSGKGGVGKSTFSAQLTYALAQDTTKQVAVLDVDICGPSIPLLMGVEGQQIHQSSSGWSPVAVEENIGVMSVGFMLEGPDVAVIWRGPKKTGMIKKFLCEVDWGDLDYLVIDTPPGTSDEHLAIVQYLNGAQIDGAIIVTTPQEVSLVDVRKEINFCKKVGIPLVGIVENMSGFVCPNCKKETEIFATSSGGAEKVASEMSVKFLGRLPLDPRIAKSSDSGQSMMSVAPDSPAVIALTAITQEIRDYCEAISVARTSMPE